MVPLRSEPFTVDPQKAQMGRQMFCDPGCASCHPVQGDRPSARRSRLSVPETLVRPTAASATTSARACPSTTSATSQRASISAALKDRAALAKMLPPAAHIARTMAALNCYACHEPRWRRRRRRRHAASISSMTASFDMGDEGSLPPRLSGVGAKLKPAAMEKIITAGELHVRRHHMATRMPRFPKEVVAPLIKDLDS